MIFLKKSKIVIVFNFNVKMQSTESEVSMYSDILAKEKSIKIGTGIVEMFHFAEKG